MFEYLERSAIIAHRGASAFAPENTIAAFQKAIELRADGIEFDVKLSKDKHIIIMHDATLQRTTDGIGRVNKFSLEELRRLDAGSSYKPEFQGELIPTLEEVLIRFSDQLILNIELTNYQSINDGLAVAAAKLVKELGVQNRVFFSSFYPKNLWITRKMLPDVPVALLALPGKIGWLPRSGFFNWIAPRYIHPFYKDASQRYIEKQHKKHRKVNVWTINDEDDFLRLVSYQADGLITDNPILARKILGLA
jgi:glycerophosphoryl diester phosphodiesterase